MKRKKSVKAETPTCVSPQIERRGLHTCKYCAKDISQATRIKCSACPSFQLCLDCFGVGAELQPHKKEHPYQVHGDLSFPLYDLDWGADEEMLLLEALASSGLGNWALVSKNVGTKTAEECKQHYYEVYIRSSKFPLPQLKPEMIGADPHQILKERRAAMIKEKEVIAATEPSSIMTPSKLEVEAENGLVGALRPQGQEDVAMVDVGEVDAAEELRNLGETVSPEASGIGGLSPAMKPPKKVRLGLGKLAEKSVTAAQQQQQQQLSTRGLPTARLKDQAQGTVDTPAAGPQGLPLQQTKMRGPANKLTGFHVKRSEFDHEYDNDAELLISELEFKSSDTEEEKKEKLQLIEVYNERLTEREKRRTEVISNGLLDLKNIQAIERRQTPSEKEMNGEMKVFARFQSPEDHERLVDGLLLERRLRVRIQELKDLRIAGVRTMSEAEIYEAEMRKRNAEASRGLDRSQRYTARTGADESTIMSQAFVASVAASDAGIRSREISRLRTNSLSSSPIGKEIGNTAAQLAAWRTRLGVGLDITAFPGADLLISKERAFCVSQRLLPVQYLAYKASFLRESQRRGGSFARQDARSMFRLDGSASLKVYDLLVSCGWLTPEIAPEGDNPGDEQVLESQASPANSSKNA